ncbi:hypothetical protein DRO97_04280 [Archaeoglobales archaeon]|nr:MAG: hypothetical protein DRO97_04280 [Archaeoglobales archaeon]
MLNHEEYLELRKTIDELVEKSENGAIIVVEGVKDRNSLRSLGIQGDIIVFSSYTDIVDKIRDKDVIILTDYDDRGKKIEKALVNKFSSWGITPNTQIKKRIFKLVSKDITTIENLAKYFFKVENEFKKRKIL